MEHLIGAKLPDISLVATDGRMVNPAQETGLCIYFCYPYTGRPGHPDPVGWDGIAGAHGSTPQALGYSEAYEKFREQGVKVFGVSFQDVFWQSEFVKRNALKVPLLSDHARKFADALKLETFTAGGGSFIKRITLNVADGTVISARDPSDAPASDAEETLKMIVALGTT